ncbi:NUDIX hydrolase [uncultured Sphingomonas sp.]|uniref:NUDIX hydrolase n=1 Tax=uncultured Sphingomonas sp. TaxID=158754 RepID=UPI0035CA36AE
MTETMWQGRFLSVHKDGTWEYAARANGIAAAVIVAVDRDGCLLLVEQYRVPVGRNCLELPAGLVGDDSAGESVTTAAARELEEETGYRATAIEDHGVFCSSPGMTSETFSLVVARGLDRVGEGGGEEGENITVHRVPLAEVGTFVAQKRREGLAVDAKMLLVLGAGILAGL